MHRPASSIRRLGLALALGLVLAAPARAQIRHQDYTLMNNKYGSGSVQPIFYNPDDLPITGNFNPRFVGKPPEVNESLTSKQIKTNMLDTKISPLNGRMDDQPMWQQLFNGGETKQPQMTRQPGVQTPTMLSHMQKNSPLNDLTAYERWQRPSGVSKYDDAYTFHTGQNNDPLEVIGRELSMQDINRYQFHSSNSSEPGLPIIHAGGNTTQAQFDSGGLSLTPRLFDFTDTGETTTHIRTGATAAPRVITPGGTRPYLPTRKRGFTPTSITASGPSDSSTPRSTLPMSAGSGPSSLGPGAPRVNAGQRTEVYQSDSGRPIRVEFGAYESWAEAD